MLCYTLYSRTLVRFRHHMQSQATSSKKASRAPVLGVGDSLGAGDSYLVENLLPPEIAKNAYENVRFEVSWQNMYHRGGEVPRLVAVEGEVDQDGGFPVYRHPADESPPLSSFSPTVAIIREYVEKIVNHPVNHVLIQHYRTGKDYISEHSDKTIDVVHGSSIVNVSLGAQRVMTLRLKKDRPTATPESSSSPEASGSAATDQSDATPSDPLAEGTQAAAAGTPRSAQKIPLPHNSMFVMGLETNAKWLHGINHDNRPTQIKTPAERAEKGARISLTFRQIGTFLNKDETKIWGQGAKSKTKEGANPVSRSKREVGRLIGAFGAENQRSDFDWDAAYGRGFDVLHFTFGDPPPAVDDGGNALS